MRELAAQRSVQRPMHTVSSKVIDHLQVIQKASTRLHDILASQWSCDERIEHIAGISLNVEDREQCRHRASKVRFSLVLTCKPQNTTSQPGPLWLKIESAPSEQPEQEANIDGIAGDEAMLQAKLRSVRFAIPSTKISRPMSAMPSVMSQNSSINLPDPLLDLCAVGRLCRHFQRYLPEPVSTEPCMGFLEKSKTFKHFVYSSSAPLGPPHVEERRLKEILQEDYEKRRQKAWIEKLNLARLLTLAVLRFHATPWLGESWSSNDIAFYSTAETNTDGNTPLNAPFLNVNLPSSVSTLTGQITHPDHLASSSSAYSLAPNPTLFSLGVVLIELGYDAPLQALRQESDLEGGTSSQFTDFFTASRLGKLVSKRLNSRYGKLVQRCLACNFGVGTELEAEDLQSAVVANVFNELDECLRIFDGFCGVLPGGRYPA